MKTLRNFAIAGTLAVAAALSSGAASAAPATALEIGIPGVSTESAATPVFHYGQHYGQGRRLCYVPFFKLVQWFGYWQARSIKYRCNSYNYYNYNYNYYNY